jgi:pectate lyase
MKRSLSKVVCGVPVATLLGSLSIACGSSPAGSSGSGGSAAQQSEGGATAQGGVPASGGGASGGAPSSGGSGAAGRATGGTTANGGASGATGMANPDDDGLMGWATAHPNGAPTGGYKPLGELPTMTCTASDMRTLRDCVFRAKKSDKANSDTRAGAPDWASWEVHSGVTGGWKKYPLVIYVKGIIDCSQNDAGTPMTQTSYEAGDPLCGTDTGAACQQAVIQAKVERGDVSVIGIPGDQGEPPTLNGGWLLFRGQENVIVRNLRIVNATDYWTSFEACASGITDRDYCAWNAEPDGLTLDNTSRVWVDHCEFTDGPTFEGKNPDKTKYKMYDGLFDIKNGSDFITLSYNQFYNHNKAMLIGATDSADGNYGITFHHNLIHFVQQRMPRVRNGQVHVLNNYYFGPQKSDYTEEYYFGYALGLGYNSQIYSEGNAFDITGATANTLLNADFDAWAQYFTDVGSWLGGQPVDLNKAAAEVINARNAENGGATPFVGPVTWSPASRYAYTADTAAETVKQKVLARAGLGKVTPDPAL